MSDTADTGALSPEGAASAFEALESGAIEAANETPETAAERLAAEELQSNTQESDGEEVDAQESEEAPEPDAVTIEVDGKPVKMTKAELAEAVKGSMRQADYTQKTMAAAAEKTAAQAEKQAAVAEREKLANQLHVYSVQMQGALANTEAQLTDQLWNEDPVKYLELERTLKKGQADLSKANDDLSALQQQHQAEQAEQRKAFQQSQHQALLGKLPDWKDPVKAKEEAGKIATYLGTQDFSGQDLNALEDHRLVVLARKAMMYDSLMERAGKAATKVAAAPAKVERPGVAAKQTTSQDVRQKQMARLGKTGKISDAAAIFAEMF